MSLWGGRFTKISNTEFDSFNNSLRIDHRLIKDDIKSSIAWSKILLDVQVLTKKEQKIIENTLLSILKKNKNNFTKILSSNSEDIHSWLETTVINTIGDLGKKLYTGRSRNDQIATDLKLWCKRKSKKICRRIIQLQNDFLDNAYLHINTIIPGYTHLQRAQPITFSYWCLAYIEMLERDRLRILNLTQFLNSSPLGSGAISGTSWEIDRKKLAFFMGFSEITKNALDSVSDRDFILDILSAAAISMMHLSRFSEDLIFYNSGEANFIELSDSITSGSSLMPQKKNPDILELIRAKCSSVYGSLFSMFSLLKGLPLSYNKDFQEDKNHLFSGLDIWEDCLKISSLVLKNIKLKKSNCKKSAQLGYSNATELAEYLVKKGISFRDSHHITGKIVIASIKKNKCLEELDLLFLKKYCSKIESDVYQHLSLESCLNKKNSIGGVSNKQIKISLDQVKKRLSTFK
ncbi:argininosuccinate lyase [Buchnera aphidicola]|uniref:Argininosuccinate lyase n=1 Tax=Buchnera aphidicola subsp. Cinara cedri (strain Cc) TaxID=372461 RepID=ARLY_BUCCC|nr:argininosuccinate lyase [Buchnera aphidicola]Q058D5.1 RecName: Full=Argininosuccinate lyase; Short=ASAL; AltName: Full=Arginosuccinase [Buchnera aphidicola BCc]ABJ90514.1 argininosuccinate lyase [Buchnera aphidicola BCc]